MSLESLKELVKEKEKEEIFKFDVGDKVKLRNGDIDTIERKFRVLSDNLCWYELKDKMLNYHTDELELYVEENYCVDEWTDVTYNSGNHNLKFGNHAEVRSRVDGDGVNIDIGRVDKVIKCGDTIFILLKGNKYALCDDDDVLWSNK